MATKTFTSTTLSASDLNTYCANSGLVYVTQVTVGSGVSSVTVSSCFSSTYDAYKIVYTAGISSTTDWSYFQLAGLTGANYFSQGFYNTSGNGTYNAMSRSSATTWQIATVTAQSFGWEMTVHNPFLAKFTFFTADGASDYAMSRTGGVCNTATSSTGFTISTGGGTITGGTITVYGFRKA